MKVYPTQNIRNIVLLGGTKSGKTTLAETMLFEGKVIDRRGTVETKTTVSDNAEIEQIYQRSIYPTLLYTEFMDHKLNIIDTPGSDDFIGGVISAFKVADTGVMIVNAQHGVEVGTEISPVRQKNAKSRSSLVLTSWTMRRQTGKVHLNHSGRPLERKLLLFSIL